MKKIKVALCGNPNVGKSTVFNSLTGLKQHTGNWTGKTVDIAYSSFTYKDKEYTIYDLPGTYSLQSHSKEEEIARDFICFDEYDFVLVVLDALCLERNLNLVLQILEVTDNVLVCVNLMDEAKRKGVSIDLENLEEKLGTKVIGISAKNKKDIKRLLDFMDNYSISDSFVFPYPSKLEKELNDLEELFPKTLSKKKRRWYALKLLDDDFILINKIIKKYDIDENKYFKMKQNIIEDGFDTDSIRTIYTTHISFLSHIVAASSISYNKNYRLKERKIDYLLTNRITGIPLLLIFLFFIFWITIKGANYPSDLLFCLFLKIKTFLYSLFVSISLPSMLIDFLLEGVYTVTTWIVAVMLPPMAIFFPLFTFLEDLGVLPRIAFNLDRCFYKCKTCGKQALTMMMGFGCNAVGVTGCRIIDSKRERLIAILTNSLVPCNGRFPTLIAIITIFLVGSSSSFLTAIYLLLFIVISIFITLFVSSILSKTFLKGKSSSFILELPHYRKPQILKVFVSSILDRTIFILGRALKIALPAGIIIWLMANICIGGDNLILIASNILDPIGSFIGLDGVILLAFILGFPANEIVVPIMLMAYMKTGVLVDVSNLGELKNILINNGWNIQVAISFILFMLFHFPCSTTLLTIHKETRSLKYTVLAFLIPLFVGIVLSFSVKQVFFLLY